MKPATKYVLDIRFIENNYPALEKEFDTFAEAERCLIDFFKGLDRWAETYSTTITLRP